MSRLFHIPFILVLSIAILISTSSYAAQRVVVIANIGGDPVSLSRSQVRDLFMSGITRVDEVEVALFPVGMPPGHMARSIFNASVVGLPESRIQSYWAQMKFSGRLKPPLEVENVSQMIKLISSTKGAVGYVPEGTKLPTEVQIIHAP